MSLRHLDAVDVHAVLQCSPTLWHRDFIDTWFFITLWSAVWNHPDLNVKSTAWIKVVASLRESLGLRQRAPLRPRHRSVQTGSEDRRRKDGRPRQWCHEHDPGETGPWDGYVFNFYRYVCSYLCLFVFSLRIATDPTEPSCLQTSSLTLV